MNYAAQNEALRLAGVAALNRALVAWEAGIVEPTRKAAGDPAFADDLAFINRTIHSEADGLGWAYARTAPLLKDFRWDGDFEWCGAFAAYAWAVVRADLRFHYFASTYRLFKYARYRSPPNKLYRYEKAAPAGTVERKFLELARERPEPKAAPVLTAKAVLELATFGVRAGDIVVVNGNDRWGQHITIARGVPDFQRQTLPTVEGNATGRGPDGKRFQGVTQNERPFSSLRHVYRPGFSDLVGVAP